MCVCVFSADPEAAITRCVHARSGKQGERRKAGPRCLFDITVEEVDFAGSTDFK